MASGGCLKSVMKKRAIFSNRFDSTIESAKNAYQIRNLRGSFKSKANIGGYAQWIIWYCTWYKCSCIFKRKNLLFPGFHTPVIIKSYHFIWSYSVHELLPSLLHYPSFFYISLLISISCNRVHKANFNTTQLHAISQYILCSNLK